MTDHAARDHRVAHRVRVEHAEEQPQERERPEPRRQRRSADGDGRAFSQEGRRQRHHGQGPGDGREGAMLAALTATGTDAPVSSAARAATVCHPFG